MSDYSDNENKKILKVSALNVTVCVMFLLLAVLFSQIGNPFEMQPAFATSEAETTSSAEVVETPSETEVPEATESPQSTPDETSEPDETGSPERTENPDETSDTVPTETADPSETEPGENPESTDTSAPEVTGSVIPDLSMTPEVVTPSPTLAGIEEPIISGNVIVDVEDKNDPVSDSPVETYDVMSDDIADLMDPTPAPIGNVDDKGSISSFFDVMVYVFIACAVLTAGYGIYLAIKLVIKKKKGSQE